MKSKKIKCALVAIIMVVMLMPNVAVIAVTETNTKTSTSGNIVYGATDLSKNIVFGYKVTSQTLSAIPQAPYGGENIRIYFEPTGECRNNPVSGDIFTVTCLDDGNGGNYFETFQALEGSETLSKVASVYPYDKKDNISGNFGLQTNLRIRGKGKTDGAMPVRVRVMTNNGGYADITLFNVRVTDQVLEAEGAGIALSSSGYTLAVGDTTTVDFGQAIVWKNVTCQYSTVVNWIISNKSVISATNECTTSFWTTVRGLSQGTSTISAEVTIKDSSGATIATQKTEPVTVTVGAPIERELKFDMSFNSVVLEKVGDTYSKRVGNVGSDGKGAITIQNYTDGQTTADGIAKISSNGADLVVTGMKQGVTRLNIYTRDAEYMGPRTAITPDGKGRRCNRLGNSCRSN